MSASDPRIRFVDSCTSTNDLAHELVDMNLVNSIVADEQTKGRGRNGRTWISSRHQGLYLSWKCKPDFSPAEGGTLPLLAAVGLYDLCVSLGIRPQLKWPNDILVGDKKLAGILCEARVLGQNWYAVVGVGLNLSAPNGGWQNEISGTSLDEHMTQVPHRDDLASELLDRLEQLLDLTSTNGSRWLVDQWMERGPTVGTEMKCQGQIGQYQGLNADGSIQLSVDGKDAIFSAGDVEHV